VVTLEMPRCVKRREDIPLYSPLITLLEAAAQYRLWPHLALARGGGLLAARPWPGNVREFAERFGAGGRSWCAATIGPETCNRPGEAAAGQADPPFGSLLLRDILAETERA